MSASKRWLEELDQDLKTREDAHLRRRLVASDRPGAADFDGPASRLIQRDGRTLINFASNDYLALADHPRLKQAAIDAINRFGTGTGASRLVTGHLPIHEQVEQRLARFKHAQAALLCATGYLANLAVLTTLAGPGDLICIDKLSHASLIDAARASGATVRTFAHRDHARLARLLTRNDAAGMNPADAGPHHPHRPPRQPRQPRRFIVTDSVFSMDGDCADLPGLCDLAEQHQAITIIDEAHGTGILGATGGGLCEAQGVTDRVDVVISTASKALGSLGGIITARQVVIDTLINHARSFIYTTSVPAAQAATIAAALDVLHDEPWRRERLSERVQQVRALVAGMSSTADRAMMSPVSCHDASPDAPHDDAPSASPHDSSCPWPIPIIPIITGSAASALDLAAHLASFGIHAPAIRPPTVAPNAARVRLSLRADMTDSDVQMLAKALQR